MSVDPPKVCFAGHQGMVGSAIVRALLSQDTPSERMVLRTRDELNLTVQADVRSFRERDLLTGQLGPTNEPYAFEFDLSKPDGAPRELMDSGRLMRSGWCPRTELKDGLRRAYADFLSDSSTA